jgi:hypothetical protein
MPTESVSVSPMPPDWWNLSLYSFLTEDLPLEGWVWEFMRRNRLQEVLRGRPTDAMNPNPDLEIIEDAFFLNYYKPWNHPYWREIGKAPHFLPKAVNLTDRWPTRFEGQQYRLEDDELRNFVKISIDINRRDRVIRRDFWDILSLLRNEYPEPSRILPRTPDWIDLHILQVWDLREFDVSWRTITELVGLSDPAQDRAYAKQRARNAFNTACDYINNGKWVELARYIEL